MSRSIKNMFDGIASKYDLLNTVLSFGIHHYWRAKTVKEIALNKKINVLDCATGTGDLALAIKSQYLSSKITGLDFSNNMLDIARQKMLKLSENVNLVNGDILRLPFRNNIFDITTISFGIRNVDNTLLGLKEMARVTKPGGKVIVLEFGKPKGLMKSFYILYSKIIMPFIGGIISGNKGAYSYLPATALSYPCREKFIRIMQETSMFQNYSFEPLTGGIAYLYVGIVKDSK